MHELQLLLASSNTRKEIDTIFKIFRVLGTPDEQAPLANC